MATSAETAKDLLTVFAGPPVIGALALNFLMNGLSGDDRTPRKGWTVLGVGAVVTAWLGLFLVLAARPVFDSWSADGDMDPMLVGLSATWVVAVGAVLVLLAGTKRVLLYLVQSYHPDDRPRVLCWVAKRLR